MEDAEENSMFETSHVLGALLASSPLLARAWDRCLAAAAMGAASSGFVHDDGGGDGGTVYVAFSGLQAALSVAGPAVASGADVFAPVRLGGDAAGARAFPQLAAAEPDAAAAGERVAVQALALRCFLKLCGSPEFQMRMIESSMEVYHTALFGTPEFDGNYAVTSNEVDATTTFPLESGEIFVFWMRAASRAFRKFSGR